MRLGRFTTYCLLGAGLLAAPLSAWAEAEAPSPPVVHAPPSSPLAGLWSLNLGVDLASLGSQDLKQFYAPGAISGPADRYFPGFYLGGRLHVNEIFFLSLGLSSLPKGYVVQTAGGEDSYQWDALFLNAGLGWMLWRSTRGAVYTQAEAGWLTLAEGSFERTGAGATKGLFEGSALATQLSFGWMYFLMPSVALEAGAGWRFARLPLSFTTAAGHALPNFTPEYYADFSGPFGRLGLAFFWGLKNPWGESEAPPPPSDGPPQ
jgi:hypothetical protein